MIVRPRAESPARIPCLGHVGCTVSAVLGVCSRAENRPETLSQPIYTYPGLGRLGAELDGSCIERTNEL